MELYQTLQEFLNHPFNPYGTIEAPGFREEKQRLDAKYEKCMSEIYFVSSTEFEGSYFLHIRIPSESRKETFYDVVIQFFTTDPSLENKDSLSHYLLQFFSNSPSFIYKYAALYRSRGYMIDAFQSKLNAKYMDTPPTKQNKGGILLFDKSLYLACKYILDNRLSLMSKVRLKGLHRVSMKTLINNIASVDEVSISRIEAEVRKEIEFDKKKSMKSQHAGERGGVAKSIFGKSPKKSATATTIHSDSPLHRKTTTPRNSKKGKIQARHTTTRRSK